MHQVKRPFAYLLILLALFMQIFISDLLKWSYFKPNLMIATAAFFALFTDKRFGFETGLLGGVLLDIFSIRFFGLNAVLFAFSGYIIGKYSVKFYKENIITHIILIFIMSFIILSVHFLFVNFHSEAAPLRVGFETIFNKLVLIPSLVNSFLGILIFAFFSRIFRLNEGSL